jgi:acetyltransferase-like isoleucine patch superfamily enzyme
MKIYILGTGTLGRLIAEIIESIDNIEVGGFFDDGYPSVKKVFTYDVLGKFADADNKIHSFLAIGIGEPKYRKSIYEEKAKSGFSFPSIIHSSCVISKYCSIEDGVIIGSNSSVLNGSLIKKGSCLLSHVNVNQDVVIEPYCLVAAGVVIGNNALLGEGCHIGLGNIVKLNQEIKPWTTMINGESS